MNTQRRLTEILLKLYKEAYAMADPPYPDFDNDKLMDCYGPYYFEYFYLSKEDEQELIENFLKKYRSLNTYQKEIIKRSYILGCSPTGNRELVNRKRSELSEINKTKL